MDKLSQSFEEAWERFQSLRSLRLVADTLEWEWTRGRADFLAFLAAVDDPAVQAHIHRILSCLEGIPGVEPYPPSYWHVTAKGAGFQVEHPGRPDEMSPGAAAEIAEAAASALHGAAAFEARIGLAGGFESVVFLEVHDGGRFAEVNRLLLEALPGLPRYPSDVPYFLPHISIARFTSSEGIEALQHALARAREAGAGPSFTVREIRLVRARLREAAPEFHTVATYPLQR